MQNGLKKANTQMSTVACLLCIEILTEVYVTDANCAGATLSVEKLASKLKLYSLEWLAISLTN